MIQRVAASNRPISRKALAIKKCPFERGEQGPGDHLRGPLEPELPLLPPIL